jgi:mannose/fructose-specific phosphotransferase system component IIA
VSDLRKAAEQALEALEDIFGKEKKDVGAINALRQALTPEVTPEVTHEVDETAHDVPKP